MFYFYCYLLLLCNVVFLLFIFFMLSGDLRRLVSNLKRESCQLFQDADFSRVMSDYTYFVLRTIGGV